MDSNRIQKFVLLFDFETKQTINDLILNLLYRNQLIKCQKWLIISNKVLTEKKKNNPQKQNKYL